MSNVNVDPRLSFLFFGKGARRGVEESLVHTVCICAKIPRNLENLESYVKYHDNCPCNERYNYLLIILLQLISTVRLLSRSQIWRDRMKDVAIDVSCSLCK